MTSNDKAEPKRQSALLHLIALMIVIAGVAYFFIYQGEKKEAYVTNEDLVTFAKSSPCQQDALSKSLEEGTAIMRLDLERIANQCSAAKLNRTEKQKQDVEAQR